MTERALTPTAPKPELLVPLLRECFEAGDVVSLFPLMKDWPREKLAAVLNEIEAATARAETEWEKMAFEPQYFFFRDNAKKLDDARWEFFSIMSEISSVAIYYMKRRKAEG